MQNKFPAETYRDGRNESVDAGHQACHRVGSALSDEEIAPGERLTSVERESDLTRRRSQHTDDTSNR